MPEDRPREPTGGSDLYRRSARSWDAKFGAGDHYATDRPFAGLAAVIDEFRRRAPVRALDVGCGDGRNLRLLTDIAPHVFGVDLAEQGLRRARRRSSASGAPVGLVLGDVGCLPFRDGLLDAAVNVWVMNHGTHGDIERYLAEMARVLRRGGLLFASVTAWSPVIAAGMLLFGRRIADASLDGHSYMLRFRSEEGVHHFFTRREMLGYFDHWRILRLWRQRFRAESPIRIPFWNILAERR